jgi:hypothetical protein
MPVPSSQQITLSIISAATAVILAIGLQRSGSPTRARIPPYHPQGGRVTVVGKHGIAISPETNQGFTTEGHPGVAVAFDLKTLRQTQMIATARDAEAYFTSQRPNTSRSSMVTAGPSRLSIRRTTRRLPRSMLAQSSNQQTPMGKATSTSMARKRRHCRD